MSNASDSAQVSILMSDYAVFDPSNQKTTILGAGIAILQGQPISGLTYDHTAPNQVVATPPFSVVASVFIPSEYTGEEYALSLDLRDSAGNVISIPGEHGEEKMRITQLVQVEAPHIPGVRIPREAHKARYQMVANFANGLPLPSNKTYCWTVEIDGNKEAYWQTDFYLFSPHVNGRGPVIG